MTFTGETEELWDNVMSCYGVRITGAYNSEIQDTVTIKVFFGVGESQARRPNMGHL